MSENLESGDLVYRDRDGVLRKVTGEQLISGTIPPATPRHAWFVDDSAPDGFPIGRDTETGEAVYPPRRPVPMEEYRLPIGRDAKTGELVYSGLRGESVSPLRVALYMSGGGIIGLLLGLAWQHFHP